MATAVCTSAITYIDGAKGILRYRGYPLEQLAERSSFLEAAFLLLYGVRVRLTVYRLGPWIESFHLILVVF